MRRILLATSIPFWRQRRGSDQRIASLVRALRAAGWEPVVFYLRQASQNERALVEWDFGATLHDRQEPLPDDYYIANPTLERFANPEIRAEFQRLVATVRPDVVLIEYIELAYLVEHLDGNLRAGLTLVIDTHDVMHRRFERFRQAGEPHWVAIDKRGEADALKPFDFIVAIQELDAREFRDLAPHARVVTARHAPQVVPAPRSPRTEQTIRFGFIGVANAPNTSAARFLLQQVWPRVVDASYGAAQLVIAGPVCERLQDLASVDPSIDLLGEIDDIGPFFQSVDALLNPVPFGGGLKIKNVEALAHGLPLVTTPVGAEGLGGEAGEAYLVAESVGEWAAHCRSLVENRAFRRRVGEAARCLARARFHPTTAYTEFLDAISSQVAHKEVAA